MARSTDHARTRISLHRWRETTPAGFDPDTGLPKHIGPFCMHPTNGVWEVGFIDQMEPVEGDGFDAFRVMLDKYQAWHASLLRQKVYFVGQVLKVGYPVKIGIAHDVNERLRQLQIANPRKLQLFATAEGGSKAERHYHERYRRTQLEGEWFRLTERMVAEIGALATL